MRFGWYSTSLWGFARSGDGTLVVDLGRLAIYLDVLPKRKVPEGPVRHEGSPDIEG